MYDEKLQTKGLNAAKKFLETRNFEILQENYEFVGRSIDLVAKDLNTDDLVFVDITTDRDKDTFEKVDSMNKEQRNEWEHAVLNWVAIHDEYCDIKVRRDTLTIVPVSENRALLRHHINVVFAE